jgi:dolichol-phosphate mannosyltransferase
VKISIIIPAYNEARTLEVILERALRAPLPKRCVRELIVVDDGSTDETPLILKKFATHGSVLCLRLAENAGKGCAIRYALSRVTGEIVLIQDGDLEYDPNDYTTILEPLAKGRADVVYGSRFLHNVSRISTLSLVCNKALTFAANIFYRANITDEATGYKAFRTAVLKRIVLQSARFEFCAEVTAKLRRLDYEIMEVPVSYHPRGIAEGKKIRAHDGFEALWTLIKYRFAPRANCVTNQGISAVTPPR